ncbi:MAG: hypothetical protein GKS00_10130 [Alphaproteobacteria bacterium]|nr:hypothetical protein [Alphaproteobacteria bacterium]
MTTVEFPDVVDDRSAWTAPNYRVPRSWVHDLTSEMVDEIAATLETVIAQRTPFFEITRETFPLPKTGEQLRAMYDDLEDGCGFAVLGDWPVDEFDYERNLLAFSGISSHLGCVIVQNYEGDNVVDVTDKGIPYSHRSRGYSSNKLLPFHSDGADLAGLLCLGVSASGGRSVIVSATALYNTVANERPDLMPILLRGFYHHRRGQHDPGESPLSPERIPVFSFHDGHLHCCYNRNPIDWVEKEGMRLDGGEVAALDFVDEVVARPDMQLTMDLRKGDMQFVNNFVILHSRTEYVDDESHRRHLLRLWLENPKSKRNGMSLLQLYVPGAGRFQATP